MAPALAGEDEVLHGPLGVAFTVHDEEVLAQAEAPPHLKSLQHQLTARARHRHLDHAAGHAEASREEVGGRAHVSVAGQGRLQLAGALAHLPPVDARGLVGGRPPAALLAFQERDLPALDDVAHLVPGHHAQLRRRDPRPVEIAEEPHRRIDRVRLCGAADVHGQGAGPRLAELGGDDPRGTRPLGHPREHPDRLGAREGRPGAEGVVREGRQDVLRDQQRRGHALRLTAELGTVLHLQEVVGVARSEQALGALVPAQRTHEVAHEGPAVVDASLGGHVASLAVQGGDEPAHPRACLVLGGARLEGGSRVQRGREHVERHQQRRLASEAGLLAERDRGGFRPDRGPRDLLGRADDAAQVGQLLPVEDVAAVLRVAAAGRCIEGVDELAPVRRRHAPRLLHRLVGERVLGGLAPVHLAGGCGTDVVALRRELPHVAQGIRAGRHRLRLQGLQLPEGRRRELVRDDTPQVVLEVEHVDDGHGAGRPHPDLEHPAVRGRLDEQRLLRADREKRHGAELLPCLDEADGLPYPDEGRARHLPVARHALGDDAADHYAGIGADGAARHVREDADADDGRRDRDGGGRRRRRRRGWPRVSRRRRAAGGAQTHGNGHGRHEGGRHRARSLSVGCPPRGGAARRAATAVRGQPCGPWL